MTRSGTSGRGDYVKKFFIDNDHLHNLYLSGLSMF